MSLVVFNKLLLVSWNIVEHPRFDCFGEVGVLSNCNLILLWFESVIDWSGTVHRIMIAQLFYARLLLYSHIRILIHLVW
jgi:hypothetical protein